jgi:hypothetical protein
MIFTMELLLTIIIIAGFILLFILWRKLIYNYDKVEIPENRYNNPDDRFSKSKFQSDLIAADLTKSTRLVNTISSKPRPISVTPRSVSVEPRSISVTPLSVSVTPRSISALPEKRISLVEGEHRVFQNVHINDQQYSFGFPKPACQDQRVWVGLNKKEVERISKSEAEKRLKGKNLTYEIKKLLSDDNRSSNKLPDKRSPKAKSKEAQTTGFCNKCSKKLRGDTSKSLCHECWSKGNNRTGKYGHCNICGKKLQGDKSKTLCYACWSDN